MSPAQVQRSWRSFALPCFLLSTNSIAYLCKYIKAKGTKICTNIYVQICIMRIYMLSTVLCYTSFKYLTGEKEVVTMSPASKAQQRAVNKYMKKNYDRVNLVMPKGRKDAIRAHAEKNGESLNGFINRAIDEAMERDDHADSDC